MQQSLLRVTEGTDVLGKWEAIWFDEGHQHMLMLRKSWIYRWQTGSFNAESDLLFKAPNEIKKEDVKLAKLSLDSKILALQKNSTSIVVHDLIRNNFWNVQIKSPNDNIILEGGVFWSEHGGGSEDLIIVTTRGLELYKISSQRNQCKLSRTISQGFSVHAHYWYEPNFRVMMMASPLKASPNSARFQRALVSPGEFMNADGGGGDSKPSLKGLGQLVLNGFFFKTEKESMPKLELPPPDRTPRLILGENTGENDVSMLTLYGRLFCAVHSIGGGTEGGQGGQGSGSQRGTLSTLSLYHVEKTLITYTHELFLQGIHPCIRTSVYDNLLLVHSPEGRTSFLYDVQSTEDLQQSSTTTNSTLITPTGGRSSPSPAPAAVRVMAVCVGASMVMERESGGARGRDDIGLLNEKSTVAGGSDSEGEEDSASGTSNNNNSNSISGNGNRSNSRGSGSMVGRFSFDQEQKIPVSTVSHTDHLKDARLGLGKSKNMNLNMNSNTGRNSNINSRNSSSSSRHSSSGGSTHVHVDHVDSRVYEGDKDSPWTFRAPHWLWNSEQQRLYTIRSCLGDIAAAIPDPRQRLSFLMRRGQRFSAPRPVFEHVHAHPDGLQAKQLLLHCVGSAVEGQASMSFLEAVFAVVATPYVREQHRVEDVRAWEVQQERLAAEVRRGGGQPNSGGMGIINKGQSQISTGTDADTGAAGEQTEEDEDILGLFAFASSVQNVLESTQQTILAYAEQVTASERLARVSMDANGCGGDGVLLVDDSNLEPPHALRMFLSDITTIGSKQYQEMCQGPFGKYVSRAMKGESSSSTSTPPANSANNAVTEKGTTLTNSNINSNNSNSKYPNNEEHAQGTGALSPLVPVNTRRDEKGNLVLSQTELLSHVWLPMILVNPTYVDLEYAGFALSLCITVYRGLGTGNGRGGGGGGGDIHPAMSMLLIKLLLSQKRFSEIGRLLQLQFFPDAVEVAMTALELCDAIKDSHRVRKGEKRESGENQIQGNSDGSAAGNSDLNDSNSGSVSGKQIKQIKQIKQSLPSQQSQHFIGGDAGAWAAFSTLQQAGLDMLWRLRKCVFVVRWLLGHAQVTDAMTLCQSARNSIQSGGLAPSSVPGVYFFNAVIKNLGQIDVVSGEIKAAYGRRVSTFHSVYRFVSDWDRASLVVNSDTGVSRISEQVSFPHHLFNEKDGEKFRQLLGYSS